MPKARDSVREPTCVHPLPLRHRPSEGELIHMEIKKLGPPLRIEISDLLGRNWPRGIHTAMAARVVAATPRRA